MEIIGNTGVRLFCVLGAAAMLLASCAGSSSDSAFVEADSQDELTIPLGTVDIDGATFGDELPEAATDDTVTIDTRANLDPSGPQTKSGGVVPKTSGTAIGTDPAAAPERAPAEIPRPAPKPPTAAPLPNEPVSGAGASAIELRIADLTNQLRTNPNGPLKRTGKVPTCNGTVQIDPASGQPKPVAALKFDDKVSAQMARPWSVQMSPSNFKHRGDQLGFLQGIGVSPRTAGENIAYHAPPRSDPAMFHFTQWRQSDGHFCNMMSPSYTSIGVGEDQHGGGSFATQNFYG